MPLHLHRSNRAEELVAVLASNIAKHKPADPFIEIPIVVGARGMERWLRNQIASHRGVAARLAFPFPRPAIDGAVSALIGAQPADQPFWKRPAGRDAWDPERLTWRLVSRIRKRLAEASVDDTSDVFARVRRYLSAQVELDGDSSKPVSARELVFATEVAEVLDRTIRQRPDVAARWLQRPDSKLANPDEASVNPDEASVNPDEASVNPDEASVNPDEAWLSTLLRDLAVGGALDHPIEQLQQLETQLSHGAAMPRIESHLHVFGLSTLPREELRELSLITAAGLHVHLYLLAPSVVWLRDHVSRKEVARGMARLRREANKSGDEASGPTLYDKQRVLIDQREASNPLLADLGRPSRDVQALLEVFAGEYQEVDASADGMGLFVDPLTDPERPKTALRALQHDLLFARAPGEATPSERSLSGADTSVSLHPCHGALRQVEVLREELLRTFSADKTLEPRHVLIMTPDIATYAPLVAAVFGEPGTGQRRKLRDGSSSTKLPAIPVSIADLGLRATNAVADVLLSLLELATERVTLAGLLDLLAFAPLRERFGLAADDLGELQRMLVESGVRWGVDAQDRADVQQPRLHQNTVAFGVERVALGALFLDETDLDDGAVRVLRAHSAVDADDGELDFVPFDATSASSLTRFGRLYACARSVLWHREQVRQPATARQWQRRLDLLLSDLTETSDAASWLKGKVAEELRDVLETAGSIDPEQLIELSVLRSLLNGRFEIARAGDRQVTGAVTMCAMEPMRSVPFKLVALLGMDDGSFPRPLPQRAWNPLTRDRRMGEHDRRDVDRHLILEALLSTRERFVVTWSGYDPHTGAPRPPAVPVSELLDVLDARFDVTDGSSRRPRDVFVHRAALQPWSEAGFSAASEAAGLSFDAPMRAGAEVLRQVRSGAVTAGPLTISPGDLGSVAPVAARDASQTVDVAALARDLLNPSMTLLRNRFGIRLVDTTVEISNREPVQLDGLEKWKVRDAALQLAIAGKDAGAEELLARRWRAEGHLPIGLAAAEVLAGQVGQARTVVADALAAVGLGVADLLGGVATRNFSTTVLDDSGKAWVLVCADLLVAEDPADAEADVLVFPFAGALGHKRLVSPWLTLLVAQIAHNDGRPMTGAVIVTRDEKDKIASRWLQAPADQATTRAHLGGLLTLWSSATTRPLPLFANFSPSVNQRLSDAAGDKPWFSLTVEERDTERVFARTSWADADNFDSDSRDRWIQAVFGEPDFDAVLPEPGPDTDPTAEDPEWVALARQMWSPIMASLRAGKQRAAETEPAGGAA